MTVSEDDWVDLMERFQRANARAALAEREVVRLREELAALRAQPQSITVPAPKAFDGSTPLVSSRARHYSTERVGGVL